jgi:hypothetical protein
MAGCASFSLETAQDTEEQVERIRSLIENSGGQLDGDTRAGRFSGSVSPFGSFRGQYAVNGHTIIITITRKPFGVPCRLIESKIRDYFR